MKTKKVIFCLILMGITYFSEAQTYFNNRYDFNNESGREYAENIIDEENSFLIQLDGEISTYPYTNRIGFIRIDYNGNIIGSPIIYSDTVYSIQSGYPGAFFRLNDLSGYALAGYKMKGVTNGRWDRGWLMRFDQNLDTIWTKSYSDDPPHDTSFMFRNIRELPDKGFIIVGGHIKVDGTGNVKLDLHKTDSLGNLIWRKYYGTNPNVWYSPRDVIQTSDGGYCLSAGYYPDGSTSQDDDPILLKTDSLGNQLWILFLGNSQCFEEFAVVDLAKDGNIQCGSSFSDTCAGGNWHMGRIYFIKVSNSKVVIWDKKYGFSKRWLETEKIRVLEDGDIVAVGRYEYGKQISWILKTDSAGNELWYREYILLSGENSQSHLYNVAPTSDNGFIACGTVYPVPPDTGTQDSWVLKVDSLGCEAPGECWVGQDEIWVKTFTPDKPFIVYPNPATDKLTVEFHNNPQGAEFELYDLTYRQVLTGRIAPNRELIELDIGKLKGGLYILKVIMPGKRPVMEKVVVK